MKRLKMIMPFVAIVLALGLAFASSQKSESLDNLFVQLPGECRQVTTDCIGSGAVCTFMEIPVYGIQNSPTQCSFPLERAPL